MAIEKLKIHKSPGIDQIPAELIKVEGRTICCEIHKLIISIWNKEELPEEWKESIIVPIYKKGDKTDETWVYGNYVETKVQSSQWMGKLSPRPKKACQSCSNVKVMLIVFFIGRVSFIEFVPCGETVNKEFYLNVLKCLREAV